MALEMKMKDDRIIAKLNLEFYDVNSVEESIVDFEEVCDVVFDKGTGEIEIVSKDEEMDSREVFQEFCNYVLGVMKNNQII